MMLNGVRSKAITSILNQQSGIGFFRPMNRKLVHDRTVLYLPIDGINHRLGAYQPVSLY